jgi:adenosylmethionine-8-amino-7-oxononanoate aminotransferase
MSVPQLRPRRISSRVQTKNLILGFASPAALEADGPLTLVRGKGVYVWDEDGNKYLDGLSSLWNANIGHGRSEVAAAIAAQTRTLSYAPTLLGFASEPAARLAARIARWAPKGLTRVVFTSGGSEANETVIRLVRLYWRLRQRPDKIKIVALNRAYHGSSNGAASLTGLPYFHEHYEPLLPGVARMVRPFCYRCELNLQYPSCALACADELERIIEREGADAIGAFIAEPIQGVGGVIVPPPGYFERIRAICDRHEILMIVDEVITGFGRTGRRFAIEHWNAVPDMLVFAKGVTSGYLPLGGVVVRESVFQTLIDAGPSFALHHGFTYSGHPVVCAAALANLDIIEREQLIRRVRKLAPRFRRRLEALRHHPIIGDVRAIGLMGALELVRDRATKQPFPGEMNVAARVRRKALERGVIVRASVDNVVLCPPFIITPKELDVLFDTLDAALADVTVELGATSTSRV